MVRTRRFYEVYFPGYQFQRIQDIYHKLVRVEKDLNLGIVNEDEIRSLNDELALKICLMEGKWNLFKAIIKPFIINGEVKYLVDPFSHGMDSYVGDLYTSYAEAYRGEMERAKMYGRDIMSFDELAVSVIIIPDYEKKQILDLMFNLDYSLIEKMKIKDVLARQISGWKHPIDSKADVIRYSELSNLIPSLELYGKNIRTIYNDTAGCYQDGDTPAACEIRIDYSYLSPDNKLVADGLVKNNDATFTDEGDIKGLSIFVKGDREEEILSFNDRMFKLISGFRKQDVLYEKIDPMRVYNEVVQYESILSSKQIIMLHGESINLSDLVLIANSIGYEYVYAESTVWRNIGAYRRHLKYQEELKQKKLTIG